MNQATQDVIEFLNHPDLDFGQPEDVDMLDNPELLHQKVRVLLDDPPSFLASQEEALNLRHRLHEADWHAVAHEFRTRLSMASGFFDEDAQTHLQA